MRADDAVSPSDSFASDPSITIKYLPGKYYEQRAQDAVKRKDFRQALEMFQKAGYWGNKIAQYDVGMLYLNGAEGVPADKIRGIAWLGIAAQTHTAYVGKALGDAYATLTPEQKAAAGELWKQLKIDYDDKATLDRASKKFNDQYIRDKGTINGPPEYTTIAYGDFSGGGGDQAAQSAITQINNVADGRTGGQHVVNAAKFLSAVKDQFSDFVHVQFGAVEVGEPETVSEHDQRLQQAPKKP
ncbi:MAG: hypothetical protein QM741_13140 [Rudaea sp.]|uniref:hypothetical protein n=1 Tax=Rudaea sp. TaxID=2136325 RepID=UPI0039E6A10C